MKEEKPLSLQSDDGWPQPQPASSLQKKFCFISFEIWLESVCVITWSDCCGYIVTLATILMKIVSCPEKAPWALWWAKYSWPFSPIPAAEGPLQPESHILREDLHDQILGKTRPGVNCAEVCRKDDMMINGIWWYWVSIGRYWLIHDGTLTFIRLPQLKETIETREERVTRETEA